MELSPWDVALLQRMARNDTTWDPYQYVCDQRDHWRKLANRYFYIAAAGWLLALGLAIYMVTR